MSTSEVTGFVKAEGKKLVNGDGREFLLRGVGLGSWLLPEGYMWRFPKEGDRPRRIERLVETLVGREKAERFWEAYYDRYVAEADIRQIAAEGFNSVRVPINARALLEDGEPERLRADRIALLDRLVGWCRTYRVYVILDLHGAPGGQTGSNIDDSERDLPELFTDERNRRLTVELWRLLAGRYKDEWIVAGYDLLNEPLPEWFAEYNRLVMPLYRDIVKAIREVDARHMIILEGVHWSTDWSIFDDVIDGNVMLQFHKYWNNPDTDSIRKYLDMRESFGVPIFMGEGGENNKSWYAGAFQLFEDHDISWNFWTWKKMSTDNSPCSVIKPCGWDKLVRFLEGGDQPDEAEAERILGEYVENIRFENCAYLPEVVNALLRRTPVRIPAVFYGNRGEGDGFGFGPAGRSGSSVGFRTEDGTDIRFVNSSRAKAYFQHGGGEEWREDERLCVRLRPGDWLAYDFKAAVPGLKLAAALYIRPETAGGMIAAAVDGEPLGAARPDGDAWQPVRLESRTPLPAGRHRITIRAEGAPVFVEWLDLASV
jgi:hypothetical protein